MQGREVHTCNAGFFNFRVWKANPRILMGISKACISMQGIRAFSISKEDFLSRYMRGFGLYHAAKGIQRISMS